MPRIREIDDPGDDPILKDLWAKEQERFGFILNTTKIQAHTPGILKAAKQLSVAVDRSGLLPPAAARPRLPARGAHQRLSLLN